MSRLHPVHYLALKDMMLRDGQKHGAVSRQEVRSGGMRGQFSRMLPICLEPLPSADSISSRQYGPSPLVTAPCSPQARNFFRLDPQRCLKLYELWVSMGWVMAPAGQGKSLGAPPGVTPVQQQQTGGASLSRRNSSGVSGDSAGAAGRRNILGMLCGSLKRAVER